MTSHLLDDYDYERFGSDVTFWPGRVSAFGRRPLYFHITNQTSAGDSAEFPVATDVVLKDLRVIQWYADGSCREVVLLDGDGCPESDLSTRTVFLESADNPPPHPFPLEAVSIGGRIEPTLLEVRTAHNAPVRLVRVRAEFLIDIVEPVPGTYLTITVSDREGNRYSIGTFGVLEGD